MTVIGTCGHELKDNDSFGYTIDIEGTTRTGEPCLDTITVCRRCYEYYAEKGMIIKEYPVCISGENL